MKIIKFCLIGFAIILFAITGCKKEDTFSRETGFCDTLTIHDTVKVHDSAYTRIRLLTRCSWRVDQLSHVIGGVYSSYIGGGINTTGIPYDKLRFSFKPDGTGNNIDQFGISYQFVWHFATPDKRSIEITVLSATQISYTWQMVEITTDYIHATVQLTINGSSNNLESFRLKM